MKRKNEFEKYVLNQDLLNQTIENHIENNNHNKAIELIKKHYPKDLFEHIIEIKNIEKLEDEFISKNIKKHKLNDLEIKISFEKSFLFFTSCATLLFLFMSYFKHKDQGFDFYNIKLSVESFLACLVFGFNLISFKQYRSFLIQYKKEIKFQNKKISEKVKNQIK